MENHTNHSSRRDPEKIKFWEATIQAQRASGLTISAFCKRREISESLFHHWKRTLRRDASSSSSTSTPSAKPAKPTATLGSKSSSGTIHPKNPGISNAMNEDQIRPHFKEIHLPDHFHNTEIEVRRGDISVFLRGPRNVSLLQHAVSSLADASC